MMTIADNVNRSSMLPRALATAASNKFFPWLLNLIGSVQRNYPGHPPIIVYDLGLHRAFVRELGMIDGVVVREVPEFVPHWKTCYTWKFWVWNDVPARAVYFIDAGAEVLRPLAGIFEAVETDGYVCYRESSWGYSLADITPQGFLERLGLATDFCRGLDYFNSGAWGYCRGTVYETCVKEGLELAREGWTLGWSAREQHRNKGSDRCPITRDCLLFRHDQTLLNILFYKKNRMLKLQDEDLFSFEKKAGVAQIIWRPRRTNKLLEYISGIRYSSAPDKAFFFQRWVFLKADRLGVFIQNLLSPGYMIYFVRECLRKFRKG